jgi:hypothetical protein
MRKILTLVMLAMIATGVQAEEKKDSAKKNKPVFTVIKENPITTIKDQNRSGTCWDYSTLSFFEAEILKATGKKYTLCEAFVANKTYMERAIQVVRYHGDCQFAQGGSAEDVLQTLKTYEGNLCSTDGQTMADVLREIVRLYPARNYALALCSHGSGWLFDDLASASQSGSRRSFGVDNGYRSSSTSGRRMNIPVLASVLSGCPHFDYILFDACFMQSVEVAYELRHTADYIIASPAEIPASGAPYTQMLRTM